MTRPSKRELEREVEALREGEGGERPGLYYFKIGGEPEPETTGFFEWDSRRGCYINENGHEIPETAAPDSDFGYNVEFSDGGEARTGPTDEEQAAIREAMSGIPDEEAGR